MFSAISVRRAGFCVLLCLLASIVGPAWAACLPVPESESFGPPANDDCSMASSLTLNAVTSGTTVGATPDSGTAPDCGAVTVTAPGVWYTVVSAVHDIVTISTCDDYTGGCAAYDSKISVYGGSCSAPVCIAANDQDPGCSSPAATVSWVADAGVVYYVLVHGAGNESGTFELDVISGSEDVVPIEHGPVDDATLCLERGNTFVVTGDAPLDGVSYCDATLPSPTEIDLYPPGYVPYTPPLPDPQEPCLLFTIDSPIEGETEMALSKAGSFEPDLRLLFASYDEALSMFDPFTDVTDSVAINGTRTSGKGNWSTVRVACALQVPVDCTDPGVYEDLDADGDCFPLCPGVTIAGCAPDLPQDCNDQRAFINPAAEEICDNGLDDDCNGVADDCDPGADPIPTVSEWGLIAMALLLLTVGPIIFMRRGGAHA